MRMLFADEINTLCRSLAIMNEGYVSVRVQKHVLDR
jgi:hypothetical protein